MSKNMFSHLPFSFSLPPEDVGSNCCTMLLCFVHSFEAPAQIKELKKEEEKKKEKNIFQSSFIRFGGPQPRLYVVRENVHVTSNECNDTQATGFYEKISQNRNILVKKQINGYHSNFTTSMSKRNYSKLCFV